MKLATYFNASPAQEPGFHAAKFPYDETAIAYLKTQPGCRWAPGPRVWLIPSEIVGEVSHWLGVAKGWQPRIEERPCANGFAGLSPKLYPYQRQDVAKVLSLRRAMLAWEMGLGKTPGAIESIRLSGAKRILIVCPAMARGVWEDELKKWWPNAPLVAAIRSGSDARDFTLNYGSGPSWAAIISYELLAQLKAEWPLLDFLVLDEAQYVKNGLVMKVREEGSGKLVTKRRTGRVQSVLDITEKLNHRAFRLFLTGTPIMTEPLDLWQQLDLLYPGRMGTWWQYANAYAEKQDNTYSDSGFTFKGINKKRADELSKRISAFVFRRTKAEPGVAEYLPPLITSTIRLRTKSANHLLDDLKAAKTKEEVDRILVQSSLSDRVEPLTDMVCDDFASGATHVGMFAWYRETAHELYDALRAAEKRHRASHVYYVDGELPEKKRNAIITEAKAHERAILVGTIASVNVGINLTKFSPSYAAELYGASGIMAQWAGRYHRVGGEAASAIVRLVVLEGTKEEHTAYVLEKRMREHGMVLKKGVVESSVVDALAARESPHAFVARVKKAIAEGLSEDEYGVV